MLSVAGLALLASLCQVSYGQGRFYTTKFEDCGEYQLIYILLVSQLIAIVRIPASVGSSKDWLSQDDSSFWQKEGKTCAWQGDHPINSWHRTSGRHFISGKESGDLCGGNSPIWKPSSFSYPGIEELSTWKGSWECTTKSPTTITPKY